MATWTSNNKLNLTGSITSGLLLSVSNADAGTIPADMSLTTYNDFNYGDDYYEYKAIYDGAYSGDYFANSVQWTASTALATLKYQYALSSDGITYDPWTSLSNAITSKSVIIANKYFKMRFVWDGGAFSDSDYLKIISIGATFTPFAKNTLIEANEMNAKFYFVGSGDLIPRGGAYLNKTNASYNLGSQVYTWNIIYCTDATIQGGAGKSLGLIAQSALSGTSSRIEFSGLNGDNYSFLYVVGKIRATYAGANSEIKLSFNGDSGATYGFYAINNTVTASYIPLHIMDSAAGANYNDLVECYIKSRSGSERLTMAHTLYNGIANTIPSTRMICGIWSSDVTLTSIVIYTGATLSTNTTFYLYGMTI